MLGVQRGPASAQQAGVLDVVVDQERVVEHLERDRGRQRLVELTAERDGGREAEGRPDRLPASPGVLGRPGPTGADEAPCRARSGSGHRRVIAP